MHRLQLKPGDVLRLRAGVRVAARAGYEPGDIVVLKKQWGPGQWVAFCPRLGKDTPVYGVSNFWERVDG